MTAEILEEGDIGAMKARVLNFNGTILSKYNFIDRVTSTSLQKVQQKSGRGKYTFLETRMKCMYLSNTTLFDGRGIYIEFTT